jgi:hypothetical protein
MSVDSDNAQDFIATDGAGSALSRVSVTVSGDHRNRSPHSRQVTGPDPRFVGMRSCIPQLRHDKTFCFVVLFRNHRTLPAFSLAVGPWPLRYARESI